MSESRFYSKRFAAKWSNFLLLTTIFWNIVALGFCVLLYQVFPASSKLLPMFLYAGVLFVSSNLWILGYGVKKGKLIVIRPFLNRIIDIRTLKKIRVDSHVLDGNRRFFGNPGLFSFSGYCWSDRIGRAVVYVSNFQSTVVIRLKGGERIVVSPEEPELFLQALRVASKPDVPTRSKAS